jgi:aryl-phospho-beta-D-glucosidase BglC (GH1 family)
MPSSNGFSSSGTLNNSVLGNSLNNSANLNSLNNAGVDPGLQVANAGSLTRAAASKWDDFEVVGSKIYDPDGREFIAKGVNINGPGFGWPGDTPNQVDNVKKWGFNSIRLNIRELGIEPKNRYAQNGTVDQIVRNFTKEGIVVMIDIHEKGGGWYNASELNKLISYSKDLGSTKTIPTFGSTLPMNQEDTTAVAKVLSISTSTNTPRPLRRFDRPALTIRSWLMAGFGDRTKEPGIVTQ